MSKSKDIVHSWINRKDGPMVIVIPKPLREELGINASDEFFVKSEDNKLVYKKINKLKKET